MDRKSIPKKIKDELLDEYNHRCAVCGGDRPQIHHIDEDTSNNELLNLLPLCPNCHICDHHNPTRKIDIPKVQLFRRYKDPAILKPQFDPIYARQIFLDGVTPGDESIAVLEAQAAELIEIVQALEMGEFYGKRLAELLSPPNRMFVMSLGSGPDPLFEAQRRAAKVEYRQKLIANREAAKKLLVELLRYQGWANA